MKLIRATVPMCPECKIRLYWEWEDESHDQGEGRCPQCKALWFLYGLDHPDWGVYIPDVEAVALDMDSHARFMDSGECNPPTSYVLRSWARRLRGEKP